MSCACVLRVFLKLFLRRVRPTASFCKRCGGNVCDFIAPDDVWQEVEPHIRWGYTLCYDCFSDICRRIGRPTIWRLVEP